MPAAGVVTAIVTLAALPAHACWDGGGALPRQQRALYAIARTESALDPQAVGRNRNGTRDIGLMQINSAWLPTLAAHGIGERDLFDPVHQHPRRRLDPRRQRPAPGYTWDAVGAWRRQSCLAPRLRRQGPPPPARRRRRRTRARHGVTRIHHTAATTEHRWSQPCPDRSPEHFLSPNHETPHHDSDPPQQHCRSDRPRPDARRRLGPGRHHRDRVPDDVYTTLLNWATGFLGKSIAIAAFILGAGIGIARSSPIPALAGVVFALFMVYVPTIIDSIMTAVI